MSAQTVDAPYINLISYKIKCYGNFLASTPYHLSGRHDLAEFIISRFNSTYRVTDANIRSSSSYSVWYRHHPFLPRLN